MWSGRTGTVDLTIDYTTLSTQPNPVDTLVEMAVSELSLSHDYSNEETIFVKRDSVLRDSAKRAYLKMRKAQNAVPFDQFKAQKKGEEFHTPPATYRIALKYSKPHTRGFMDRQK